MGTKFGEHWCRQLTRFRVKAAMRDKMHFILLRLEAAPSLRPRAKRDIPPREHHPAEQSSQGLLLQAIEMALTPAEAVHLGRELRRLGEEASGSVH